MNESESKNEKPKEERRFSREQYEFLKECSKKGEEGIKEWSQWRKKNPNEDILLEGAQLPNFFLNGVYLHHTENPVDFEFPWFGGQVYLNEAKFQKASLQNARLDYAYLQDADFYLANLEGADFGHAWLQGTNFRLAIVDNSTVFWGPPSKKESKPERVIETIDRNTIFTGVPLENVRIDPETKQLLEYNIRRKTWEDWYNGHPRLKWLVRNFWKISDYGISTKQIIKTFFKLAFVFAIVYYIWGFIDYYLVGIKDYPGIVSDLFVLEDNQEAVSCWLVPFRAIYFSIVTMTTLGFGDMYANAHSFFRGFFGHALLALQVILGYVLLGALVTRFAVLFTAGGPAGKFADEKKNRNKTTKKIKN